MNIDPWTRLHFACAMYAKCIQMMYTKYIHIYTNITILTAVDLEKGLCKQITNCASRAIKKKSSWDNCSGSWTKNIYKEAPFETLNKKIKQCS